MILLMKVTLDIPNEKFDLIEETAKELGVNSTQLMQSLLNDQIANGKKDFEKASSYVLQKNKELYKRLA